MLIALSDAEPIIIEVDQTQYTIRSIGIDEKRCYIGADDGNIIIPLSAFFREMPALRRAWLYGFTVVNQPSAERIASSLLAQGKARTN
jgi:hypothetical protein